MFVVQVPQYLLEAATEAGQGGRCNIICTQPRQIAAISVAERVASERGDSAPGTPGHTFDTCQGYPCLCSWVLVWSYLANIVVAQSWQLLTSNIVTSGVALSKAMLPQTSSQKKA